jgi:2-polyprenyl-3-methyl-5-hydroxy-6-metoxy-1,4-benzoquinol methylase
MGSLMPQGELRQKRSLAGGSMATIWNDDSGDWRGLESSVQRPRYQAMAQIIERFHPDGRVLDIGCGEAVLWDYLPRKIEYFGIERSGKAAESARRRCVRDCVVQTTAEQFDPSARQWDSIVFNEMLYYCPDPVFLLEKYAKALSPTGVIIVSIYQKPGTSAKRRLAHLLNRRRPMSNTHCTKMVQRFVAQRGWTVEQVSSVPIPGGTSSWWVCVTRPVCS